MTDTICKHDIICPYCGQFYDKGKLDFNDFFEDFLDCDCGETFFLEITPVFSTFKDEED